MNKIDAQKNAETKYANLASNVIKKLDVLAKENFRTWVEMGRLIHVFCLEISENETKWVDTHRILANNPDSMYGCAMLRKYEDAYVMWLKMKEKGFEPDIEISHVLAVMHFDCHINDKIKFLKKAKEKSMSVRDLRRYMYEKFYNSKSSLREKRNCHFHYDASVKKIKILVSKIRHEIIYLGSNSNNPLPKDIQKDIVGLLDVAVSTGNFDGF